jgi:hypothetical protein
VLGGSGPARALVAGSAMEVGEPDGVGYVWLDVPPVTHFEVVVLPRAASR